jgi:AcrR family transcriptional regulator
VAARLTKARDRRIPRTLDLLRQALRSLVREKPYEAITVKDVLERANVGRSTFYGHFRDKDELLVDCLRGLLGSRERQGAPAATPDDRILGFGLPVFEHIDHHRRSGEGHRKPADYATVHAQLREVVVRSVGEGIERDLAPDRMPRELLVRYVAATFVLVLEWWVETRSPLSPASANDVFRRLVLPALHPGLVRPTNP